MAILRLFLLVATHKGVLVAALFYAIVKAHTGEWSAGDGAAFFGKTLCVMWGLHLVLIFIGRPAGRQAAGLAVPVVVDVTVPADRPTVAEALGRLDPAIREMIATSRSEARA